MKNADSQNNVRLRLKLHRDNGSPKNISTPPAPPQPAAEPNVANWGLVDDRPEGSPFKTE